MWSGGLVNFARTSSWSSMCTVAEDDEVVDAGRGPLVELASPDRSPRNTRCTAGAAARRETAGAEAWSAAFPPSPVDPIGGVVELLIDSEVPEGGVADDMAPGRGGKEVRQTSTYPPGGGYG